MADKLLVVFDLDHTLLRINSHYYFAESFFRQRSAVASFLYAFTTTGLVGKILNRCVRGDIRRWVSLRLFGLYSQRELDDAAHCVFIRCDEGIFHERVLSLFKKFLDDERYRLAIMSATPDFIARVFAEKFGVEAFASQYRNGRLRFDMTGRKVECAVGMPGVVNHLFVSDNREDINASFANYIIVSDGDMYIRCQNVDRFTCLK